MEKDITQQNLDYALEVLKKIDEVIAIGDLSVDSDQFREMFIKVYLKQY